MSFSTDFQPIFHCTGEHHYDHIFASYPEPPQGRARAEITRLKRSPIVPEFANHTPLNLFDQDGILVKAAPHWPWELARTTVIPRAHFTEYPDGVHIPSLEDVGGVICGLV